MTTSLLLAGTLILATTLGAAAQTQPRDGGDGGAGVRSGHITSTGETVPNPGAAQSSGTTSMDKGIQSQDNKTDSSICKGC